LGIIWGGWFTSEVGDITIWCLTHLQTKVELRTQQLYKMLGWFVNNWSYLILMDMVYNCPIIKFYVDEVLQCQDVFDILTNSSSSWELYWCYDILMMGSFLVLYSQCGQYLIIVVYQFLLPIDYQTIVNSYMRS